MVHTQIELTKRVCTLCVRKDIFLKALNSRFGLDRKRHWNLFKNVIIWNNQCAFLKPKPIREDTHKKRFLVFGSLSTTTFLFSRIFKNLPEPQETHENELKL